MSDLSALPGPVRGIAFVGIVGLSTLLLGAKAAPSAAPPPAQPAVAETLPTQAPYVIGIGDTVGIHIWRDPDLTKDGIVVRPDGRISLPLVGDVQAAGITPPALSAMVTERMKEFVTDPHVTVIIEKINSYRIYILGHVLKSGEYTFQTPTRLAEALATAGGFDEFADLNHIVVLSSRGGGGGQARIEIDFKKIVSGSRLDDNIFLRPGDTVIVP